MGEHEVPEVELKDKPRCRLSSATDAVVDEAAKFLDSLGRALITTAEDLSHLMLIKVDDETLENLDLLVDAGVAKSRRQAAVSLLDEGIQAKHAVFERIRRTKDQISELRKQMHSLVEVHTT